MNPSEDLSLFTSPDLRPPIPKKKIVVKRGAEDSSASRDHKRARKTTEFFISSTPSSSRNDRRQDSHPSPLLATPSAALPLKRVTPSGQSALFYSIFNRRAEKKQVVDATPRTAAQSALPTPATPAASPTIPRLPTLVAAKSPVNVKQEPLDADSPVQPPPQHPPATPLLRTPAVHPVKQEPGASPDAVPPTPAANPADLDPSTLLTPAVRDRVAQEVLNQMQSTPAALPLNQESLTAMVTALLTTPLLENIMKQAATGAAATASAAATILEAADAAAEAVMEPADTEDHTPVRTMHAMEVPRRLRSAARRRNEEEEIDRQPAQPRAVSIRRSERIPSLFQSESREEAEERATDEDFCSGKTESNECPRCEREVEGKRKAHYKMFHYDSFFLHAPKMNEVERWVSCRVGDAGAGSSRDSRVCLHCDEGEPLYNGRIPLLKHIKGAHRDIFLRLKTSYRLFSRTRRPEDMLVNRMLN